MSPLAARQRFTVSSRSVLSPSFTDSNCNTPPAGRARDTGTRKQMPSACKLIAWITEEGTRTWAESLGLWLLRIVHKPSSYYLCTSTQRYCKSYINVWRLFIHTEGNRMASILLTRSRTPLLKTSRSLKNEFRKGNTVFFLVQERDQYFIDYRYCLFILKNAASFMNCQICVTENWYRRNYSNQFCFIYISKPIRPCDFNILLIHLLLFIPDISRHFMYAANVLYEKIPSYL